ncbi:MAG TPA: DUF4296 domain-containing protein [Cyclobacteriaceae bacterium]|nr:DUF4296 domain-containing protein [Cyclobacteriaceae bacterium]
MLVFLAGCQQDKPPSDVLSKKDYAEYLVNIYVAEAKLASVVVTPDSAMKLFQPFELSLQHKFGASDSTIQKTYQWYLAHPRQFEEVYTAVIDTLNLLEQKANAQKQ